MSTEPFFNPSPAAQGQLLEALASDQSSINHLAEFFNTTAEAISLFITTDSFATRFAAIGSTNASLVRFSAGLNLHSAVRLLNTLALKLDEQLRTIPIDYTNPLAIEQFRRRAECARQVASALYRLSRFTHEPRPARAASSDSTSNQTRTSAPTSNETRGSDTSKLSDPATQSPLPLPNLTQARASETTERSDPGTKVPAPRDQQPPPNTNAASAPSSLAPSQTSALPSSSCPASALQTTSLAAHSTAPVSDEPASENFSTQPAAPHSSAAPHTKLPVHAASADSPDHSTASSQSRCDHRSPSDCTATTDTPESHPINPSSLYPASLYVDAPIAHPDSATTNPKGAPLPRQEIAQAA